MALTQLYQAHQGLQAGAAKLLIYILISYFWDIKCSFTSKNLSDFFAVPAKDVFVYLYFVVPQYIMHVLVVTSSSAKLVSMEEIYYNDLANSLNLESTDTSERGTLQLLATAGLVVFIFLGCSNFLWNLMSCCSIN